MLDSSAKYQRITVRTENVGSYSVNIEDFQFESLSRLRTDREIFLEYVERLGTK